jgi:hypothetical protein
MTGFESNFSDGSGSFLRTQLKGLDYLGKEISEKYKLSNLLPYFLGSSTTIVPRFLPALEKLPVGGFLFCYLFSIF